MKNKTSPFDKFGNKKSNAAIKEEFRQERKQLKKDREEYFERKRAEARQRSGIGKPNFETRRNIETRQKSVKSE